MSTLIDRIETRSTNGRTGTDSATPAERLRTTMAACRLQYTRLGTNKALTAEQKAQAAETFAVHDELARLHAQRTDAPERTIELVHVGSSPRNSFSRTNVDPTDARCPEQIVRPTASTISLLPRCQPRAKGSCQWHKSNLCRIPQSLEHP